MQIGLNLFSIRNKIQSEQDLLFCLQRLKQNGYKYVQYSGAPFDVERLERVIKESGVPIVLTHVPFDRIINDTENLMEEHSKIGCKNIGLGMLSTSVLKDETECKTAIEKLNNSAKIMQENGFKFFYHHHHFELSKWNGQTILDYMIQNAPYINFTLDTYWLQYGGVDVCDTIKKLKGRIDCVHLKDYKVEIKDGKFDPIFAPVGQGNINFEKVIRTMKESDVKYYFVEQDNAVDFEDPLAQVIASANYLNENFKD